MTIQFDKQTCKVLGERARNAVAAALEDMGIEVEYRGGSYDTNGFTLKLKLTDSSVDLDEVAFKRYAQLFDFKPEDYRRRFTASHIEYRVLTLHPERPKFPVTVERLDSGKRYKMTAEFVKAALARMVPA